MRISMQSFLGCTELPLLFADVRLPVAALDTVDIHLDAPV
jgi:aspartate/glutamate racemase